MHQAQTSVAHYHAEVLPTLKRRQTFVRQQLVRFVDRYHFHPTSAELLRFVQATNMGHYDVNTIRPRLCELEASGWVRHGVKRSCAVTKATALTWVPSSPQPPTQAPLFAEVRP